jgi:Spy/CpxP family protein refolding chaperone
MICLALGLGILGFAALKRARRCHYHGGCGHSPYSHWHGWQAQRGWQGGWGGFGHRSPWVHAALARLDATPAQERAIVAELDKLRERVHAAKVNLRDGRGDLAAALRGAALDDAALGAVLGRVDGMTAEVRSAILDALRNIHAVLDDRQREQLAQLLDGGWWRGGGPAGGPYRV